jgi:hypothetical protein
MHITGRPVMQNSQNPHRGRQVNETRSPTFSVSTPEPTSSTTPQPSCPSTIGNGHGMSPAM